MGDPYLQVILIHRQSLFTCVHSDRFICIQDFKVLVCLYFDQQKSEELIIKINQGHFLAEIFFSHYYIITTVVLLILFLLLNSTTVNKLTITNYFCAIELCCLIPSLYTNYLCIHFFIELRNPINGLHTSIFDVCV